jgi:hypothetical protein
LKPFLLAFSCNAKAIISFCKSWWSARTSLLGKALMEVEGAGLIVDA